ncbi:hypothetical protein jhhlp_003294 [Lomentospora prolificans]|uniref:HECT-type E3 ubiquitin transferase n=1 Tax=Lomentospora prolificans TaxID=41688 RepID=A0A2N3NGE4_9PEZI|nr:hypothetical protein jhhlp_003294 [Lomentospora prolificans]
MNFQSFTGSSRRPRNVNLSGQPSNPNPFASSSWNRPGDPHRTVFKAQAERQQRQREREKLQAAKTLQRVYRGSVARAQSRELHRARFDEIYEFESMTGVSGDIAGRVQRAFPHLVQSFKASNQDDVRRLYRLCTDLMVVGVATLSSLSSSHTARFFGHLLSVLEMLVQADPRSDISAQLDILASMIPAFPAATLSANQPTTFFALMARLSSDSKLSPTEASSVIKASLAPLQALQALKGKSDRRYITRGFACTNLAQGSANEADLQTNVYRAFIFSFLTSPNLTLFESDCGQFLASLDIEYLASTISVQSRTPPKDISSGDGLLWLLAHFIQLSYGASGYHTETLLTPVYLLLSSQGKDISQRMAVSGHEDALEAAAEENRAHAGPLPEYIRTQLQSLVSTDSIKKLLDQLSEYASLSLAGNVKHTDTGDCRQREASGTTRTVNILSGYLLTLLQYFPDQSDNIRMRFYLSDLRSPRGIVPAVKWLWDAAANTSIYQRGRTDSQAPVRMLKSYVSQQSAQSPAFEGDAEWRAILLFLDLYIFVLRLADDDDFVGGIKPLAHHTSRIQTCCLTLEDIKGLTVFLKNFSFALYHDISSISPSSNLPRGSNNAETESSRASAAASNALDLDGVKNIITSAMQLLYDRDSRLRFLPTGHWLMTSRFNMGGFVADVVQELQRQQEEDEESDNEEDDYNDEPMQRFASPNHARQHMRLHQLREFEKKQRERYLATIGPKLEILKHMPFAIPFETRAVAFKQFIHLDKMKRRGGFVDADQWRLSLRTSERGLDRLGKHSADIRRDNVLEDAFNQFYPLSEGLKEPIYITFYDRFGEVEAGIDGGGVTKEFLMCAINDAFAEDSSWFTRNAEGLYYPNPSAMDWFREKRARATSTTEREELENESRRVIQQYEFLGRLVGKCIYEGILIDIAFAGFFLMKWRAGTDLNRYRGTVNDLRDLDEELYKGLMALKNEPGDVSAWDMYFTIDDEASFGPHRDKFTLNRNLVKDGDRLKVTNENRLLFISSVAKHRLTVQPALQTNAFIRGLRSIIDPSWLSMFNRTELQRLVGGDSKAIDVADLRRNTVYGGLYVIGDDGVEHETVRLFWKVMESFSDEQRRDVLKFVTSTPRAPLLGFTQLSPLFSIRDGGSAEDRLPSASTCINLLKLPLYRSEEVLREKLLLAISSGAGFDLS